MLYSSPFSVYNTKSTSEHQWVKQPIIPLLQAVRTAGVALALAPLLVSLAFAQAPLSVNAAAQLAAQHAPSVNPGTLVAFAYNESRLQPWAIHDNTTGASYFPSSVANAVTLASSLLQQKHSLDLGIMQVNSANMARTGLTVASAFDPASSMRAGALILVEAYRQCLHGGRGATQPEQQAALRCAASVYNTGREQAGLLNGYQARVWKAAAQVVPAIQIAGPDARVPATPEDTATPLPRRPPSGLQDALRGTPAIPDPEDGMTDAFHRPTPKEPTP